MFPHIYTEVLITLAVGILGYFTKEHLTKLNRMEKNLRFTVLACAHLLSKDVEAVPDYLQGFMAEVMKNGK